jgi:anti-anti-sigma factor
MEVAILRNGEAGYVISSPSESEWRSRVDLVTALKDCSAGGAIHTVIVDLANVRFLNSVALGSLFTLRKFAIANNTRMAVSCPNPTILRLLSTVNLPALLPVAGSVEEARTALAGGNVGRDSLVAGTSA